MTHGSAIHKQLEDIFKKEALPTTFEEAVETSKTEESMSRECFVVSPTYGIRGFIDEIWMKPNEIIIIDTMQKYGTDKDSASSLWVPENGSNTLSGVREFISPFNFYSSYMFHLLNTYKNLLIYNMINDIVILNITFKYTLMRCFLLKKY